MRDFRLAQRQLAYEARITIIERDKDGRSWTDSDGILPELRDLVVEDEQQLIAALIPASYKYFGFTKTETLRFSEKTQKEDYTSYTFVEDIKGIETWGRYVVYVDAASKKVISAGGGALDIDRGYSTDPSMTEDQALALARNFIREREERYGACCKQNDPDDLATIESEVLYIHRSTFHGLQPSWRFTFPALDTREPYRDGYLVLPDGTVEPFPGRML